VTDESPRPRTCPCGSTVDTIPGTSFAYVDVSTSRYAVLEANLRELGATHAALKQHVEAVTLPALHIQSRLDDELRGLERDLAWGLAKSGSPYATHGRLLAWVRANREVAARVRADLTGIPVAPAPPPQRVEGGDYVEAYAESVLGVPPGVLGGLRASSERDAKGGGAHA
jgi:hypothetical protein